MDSRPVVVRTDASADDFWSRVRESSDVSPDFKLNRTESFAERVQRSTPFGQQVYPRGMGRTLHVLPPVRSSRSIERIVLQKAIGDADKENADKADEDLAAVISNVSYTQRTRSYAQASTVFSASITPLRLYA
eukprot:15634-Prymnesium_polylepis.1